MNVAAVRLLVLALYRQLPFCHPFTRCGGASACNPARTPPVEPARPQATPLHSICCASPCIDAGAVRGLRNVQVPASWASLGPEKKGPGLGVDRSRGVFLVVGLGRTYFR